MSWSVNTNFADHDLSAEVRLSAVTGRYRHVIRYLMARYKFFVAAAEPGGESNTARSQHFNINQASWLPGILKRQKFKWTPPPPPPPPPRDKTTWVLVKDELWLFLENEVLGLATGQTLNSQGWNYLKRGTGWCTWHLSLKECLLFTLP